MHHSRFFCSLPGIFLWPGSSFSYKDGFFFFFFFLYDSPTWFLAFFGVLVGSGITWCVGGTWCCLAL